MADQQVVPSTKGAVLHWAARYDLLVWLLTLGKEPTFRERVVRLARLTPGESILDVGCGTGTLAIAARRLVGPNATVCGIDASPEMIARARKKAKKAGVEIEFTHAVAEALPFQDARFDVVLSSMVIHHLPRDARQHCFGEMRRVLKPGGRLLAVDFGGAGKKKRGLISHFHRHHRFDLRDVIPMLSDAGLSDVESGDVGFSDLHFVRAMAGAHSRSDLANVPLTDRSS